MGEETPHHSAAPLSCVLGWQLDILVANDSYSNTVQISNYNELKKYKSRLFLMFKTKSGKYYIYKYCMT